MQKEKSYLKRAAEFRDTRLKWQKRFDTWIKGIECNSIFMKDVKWNAYQIESQEIKLLNILSLWPWWFRKGRQASVAEKWLQDNINTTKRDRVALSSTEWGEGQGYPKHANSCRTLNQNIWDIGWDCWLVISLSGWRIKWAVKPLQSMIINHGIVRSVIEENICKVSRRFSHANIFPG